MIVRAYCSPSLPLYFFFINDLLKCGITKGTKLEALKQVFYLTPQPMPEKDTKADVAKATPEKTSVGSNFKTMTVAQLKKIAKEKGITIPSKIKKDDLIAVLS
jgi:hypothetical protein